MHWEPPARSKKMQTKLSIATKLIHIAVNDSSVKKSTRCNRTPYKQIPMAEYGYNDRWL